MDDRLLAPIELQPDLGLELPPAVDVHWSDLLAEPRVLVVDVRAPREFAEDHIPGAVSLPLFDDQERAVVGTIYRWEGSESARNWGLSRVQQRLDVLTRRLLEALDLVAEHPLAQRRPMLSDTVDGGQPLRVVACARGGQRSGAVTAFLRNLGHPVRRLAGGYRSYREEVRTALRTLEIPGPIAINGLTGCGKTHVLRRIRERFPRRVIDLELLAGHRSSVLGDVGLRPTTQKQFEAGLAREIARLEGPWTVFEWEARRIGNREIPLHVYDQLRAAPQIELRATMAQRVQILADEYLGCGGVGEVKRRLPLLASFPAVGREGVARLGRDLDAGRVADVVSFLLASHYDPRYHHGNQDLELVHGIDLRSFDEAAAEIIRWIEARP